MRPVLHPGYSILSGRAFRPGVTLADRPTGAGLNEHTVHTAHTPPAPQQIRSGIKSATDGKSGRSGWVLASCGRRSASLSGGNMIISLLGGHAQILSTFVKQRT